MRVKLQVQGLEVRRGLKRLLQDLQFTVQPGQLLVLRGANGSGKTSLIRLLAGLSAVFGDTSATGGIQYRLNDKLVEDAAPLIAYVAHHPALHPVFSVIENLQQGLSLHQAGYEQAVALTLCKQLGLAPHLPAARLSQGQQRRLAFAQLVLMQRPVWLLDEPLTALDEAATLWFRSTLAQHLEQGGLCVMSLHQEFDWPGAQVQALNLQTHRAQPAKQTAQQTATRAV